VEEEKNLKPHPKGKNPHAPESSIMGGVMPCGSRRRWDLTRDYIKPRGQGLNPGDASGIRTCPAPYVEQKRSPQSIKEAGDEQTDKKGITLVKMKSTLGNEFGKARRVMNNRGMGVVRKAVDDHHTHSRTPFSIAERDREKGEPRTVEQQRGSREEENTCERRKRKGQ